VAFSLNESLGFLTNRLANKLRAELERGFAARGHSITAEQWSVLSRLYEEDGLAQHEIAERISREKTNVARILALMERNQLIERRTDPEDNRARKVYLTAYGRSLQTDLTDSAKELLARTQQGFTEDEIHYFIEMLNRAFYNLD
jgi:DNA-binding MarR family transcriptional regulator